MKSHALHAIAQALSVEILANDTIFTGFFLFPLNGNVLTRLLNIDIVSDSKEAQLTLCHLCGGWTLKAHSFYLSMLIYSLIIIYYIRCADNHEKQSFIFHFNLLLTVYVEIRSHKVNLLPPPFPENMSTDITEEAKKEKEKKKN